MLTQTYSIKSYSYTELRNIERERQKKVPACVPQDTLTQKANGAQTSEPAASLLPSSSQKGPTQEEVWMGLELLTHLCLKDITRIHTYIYIYYTCVPVQTCPSILLRFPPGGIAVSRCQNLEEHFEDQHSRTFQEVPSYCIPPWRC